MTYIVTGFSQNTVVLQTSLKLEYSVVHTLMMGTSLYVHLKVFQYYTRIRLLCRIQWNHSKKDTFGSWDGSKCPHKRGVLISGVVLYINVIIGTLESVLIREVSLFQSVLGSTVALNFGG